MEIFSLVTHPKGSQVTKEHVPFPRNYSDATMSPHVQPRCNLRKKGGKMTNTLPREMNFQYVLLPMPHIVTYYNAFK